MLIQLKKTQSNQQHERQPTSKKLKETCS